MKKNLRVKRIIALLLAFTLVFSAQTVTVFAAGVSEDGTTQGAFSSYIEDLISKIVAFINRVRNAIYMFFGIESSGEVDEEEADGSSDESTIGSETRSKSYISMPITIRDFPADGMLFEWNESQAPKDTQWTSTRVEESSVPEEPEEPVELNIIYDETFDCFVNPSSWAVNDYKGIRVRTTTNLPGSSLYWHCIICNSDGSIKKVFKSEEAKTDYPTYMTTGCYAVWVWCGRNEDLVTGVITYVNDEAYLPLSVITEEVKYSCTITYDEEEGTIRIKQKMPNLVSDNTYIYYYYNTAINWSNTKYLYVGTEAKSGYQYWNKIICDSSGMIERVINGNSGILLTNDMIPDGGFYIVFHSDVLLVGSTSATASYNALINISETEKNQYYISYTENPKRYTITKFANKINADMVEKFAAYVPPETPDPDPNPNPDPNPGPVYKKYENGNNLGYGLLAQNDSSTHYQTLPLTAAAISGTQIVSNGGFNQKPAKLGGAKINDLKVTLNSSAVQTCQGALLRCDLVEGELGADKQLQYTRGTVDFLADYMSHTLPAEWQNAGGVYQMWYVTGTKLYNDSFEYVGPDNSNATQCLADLIRARVQNGMGTYEAAEEKYESGQLTLDTIESYYDAAFFLLHNIFSDNAGYGMSIDCYDNLRLMYNQHDDGSEYYIFNSAFENTQYDKTVTRSIYNNTIQDMDDIVPAQIGFQYARGNIIAENRFNPLKNLGYGYCGDFYEEIYTDSNSSWKAKDYEYWNRVNYNLSLEGHAKFIYYKDNDQYFTFTGDDDVYLFINGIKVLDMGGAHAVSKATINLNDVIEVCGLEDGMAYDFDFYYMERHGTAANFCIETNIMIVDPDMITTKEGRQDGVSTGYNGYINPLEPVEYGFGIENSGKTTLENLTYTDGTLNTHIGYDANDPDNILLNEETPVESLYLQHYTVTKNGASKVYNLKRMLQFNFDESVFRDRFAQAFSPQLTNTVEAAEIAFTDATAQSDPMNEFTGVYLDTELFAEVFDYLYESNGGNIGDALDEALLYGLAEARENYKVAIADWLAEGILVGEKMTVYGIMHTITEEEWNQNIIKDSNDNPIDFVFPNRVYTTSISREDNSTTKELNGTADWKVRKQITQVPEVHLYEWANHDGVTLSKHELVQSFVDVNPALEGIESGAEVILCNASGSADAYGINKKIRLNADSSITYLSKVTGADSYYYRLSYNGILSGIAKVTVYSYDVADNSYVIDYGLAVELNGNNFGILRNDTLYLRSNRYGTDYAIDHITHDAGNEEFGTFNYAGGNRGSLKYVLNKFMSGVDQTEVYVNVVERGADVSGGINKYNGVVMHETVRTLPADVMYYEDDFPALTYVETNGNSWTQYTTVDSNGESLVGTEQSADQSLNFGSDPNYNTDASIALTPSGTVLNGVLQNEDGTLTLEGDASNGTIKEMQVVKTAEVLNFTFHGTGFEIISRTLKEGYGIFAVKVEKINGDGSYTTVKSYPVIMESIGDDLYQIPVLSVENLEPADYRVTLRATGASTVNRTVYIDGIRIYNPLKGTSDEGAMETYYPKNEFNPDLDTNSKYFEIKKLVGGTRVEQSIPTDEGGFYTNAEWNDSEELPEFRRIVVDLGTDSDVYTADITLSFKPVDAKKFFVDIESIACFENEADANSYASGGRAVFEPTEILTDYAENCSVRDTVERGYIRFESLNASPYIQFDATGSNTGSSMRYAVVTLRVCGSLKSEPVISMRLAGSAVVADITSESDVITPATKGVTLMEDYDSVFSLVSTYYAATYMEDGPNNEVYIEGDSGPTAIAFYLTPDPDVSDAERTIQIGVHRKSDVRMDAASVYTNDSIDDTHRSAGYATLTYGSTPASMLDETNFYRIASGTEQYYTIDPSNLVMKDGRYLVFIGAGESEFESSVLALTSLKINGYTIGF